MQFFFVFAVLCIVCINVQLIHAQDEFDSTEQPQQPDQNQVSLTQEILEELFTIITPTCRTELENLLMNNGEISNECRYEVQMGLVQMNVVQMPNQQQQQQETGERPPQQPQARRGDAGASKASKEVKKPAVNPLYAILGLVVLLFGGAAGYIYYVKSSAPASLEAKKPKKLSRKKVKHFYQIHLTLIHKY